jgi:hypothetical protein
MERIMTSRFQATAVIACAVLLPALAHAESNQPVTRAQVRHDLVVLEQNGYQPNRDDYPVTLEQARNAIAQQHSGAPATGTHG